MNEEMSECCEQPVRNDDGLQGAKESVRLDYVPPRTESLKEYAINIRFHSVGCVIEVGCKSVPFSTVEEGMKALNAYVANPFEEKKRWNKIFEAK